MPNQCPRTPALLLLVVASFWTTQVGAQDWSNEQQRGGVRPPFGHAQLSLDTWNQDQRTSAGWFESLGPANSGAPGYDGAPDAGLTDSQDTDRPYWGLRPSDAFPINNCDDTLRNLCPDCDKTPPWGVYYFVGYDAWRGVSDGTWEHNGINVGGNLGTNLGQFSEWTGIGLQAGGSVGVYDWAGTDYRPWDNNKSQVQGFFTYGLFRNAREEFPWSAAFVQDWMLNSNFGVYGQNPTLSQCRAQVGYATSACNEFGVWGAFRVLNASNKVAGFGPTTWRPINQISAYWHHKWGLGAPDTWISIGIPEQTRLTGNGSLGDYIANARAIAPLSDRVALYTSITYMHQSAAAGGEASSEDTWNFTIGISFYPGANSRSRTVAGQCWMPQLPVANNGSFLVDTSRTYD